MNAKYGFFGAKLKEAPPLTRARTVLGLGRDADQYEIRKVYFKLIKKWHEDHHMGKPTEEEAKQRSQMYTIAYKLLTSEARRQEAEGQFLEALRQPFAIGNRVFCLGSLYGIRIYMPRKHRPAIRDPGKLLTAREEVTSISPPQESRAIYGVRDSIMESPFADLFETYYGASEDLLVEGASKWDKGGLDDLAWVRDSELALFHFLDRKFEEAVQILERVNRMVPKNIVFMYRWGVCLEALVARPRYKREKPDEWKYSMEKAIKLYRRCLYRLKKRRMAFLRAGDEEKLVYRMEPRSMLTVMMQLADVYSFMGPKGQSRSRNLWNKIVKMDPSCYEAKMKLKESVLKLPFYKLIRIAGLLAPPKK